MIEIEENMIHITDPRARDMIQVAQTLAISFQWDNLTIGVDEKGEFFLQGQGVRKRKDGDVVEAGTVYGGESVALPPNTTIGDFSMNPVLTCSQCGGLWKLKGSIDSGSPGAVFEVVHVDPDGSGMDYSGHLGFHVVRAQRCCKNCTCIVGIMMKTPVGDEVLNGREEVLFVPGELKPLNEEAKRLQDEIKVLSRARVGP